MRITNAMMMNQAMYDLGGLRTRYAKAQQAVNGRALERPSEDPQRVAEAMDLSGMKMRLERSQKAGEDARQWLVASESAVSSMVEDLQSAREFAVQSGGPGAMDPDARASLAHTVLAIRDSLVRTLNMQHRDQYLFAGGKTDVKPFDPAGGSPMAYAGGVDQEITRDVAPGLPVAINLPGNKLGADGAGGFLQTLTQMADDLMAGRTGAVTTDRLSEINAGISNLTVARSDLGIRQNQVEQYADWSRDAVLRIDQRLTDVTGGDLETAVLRMSEAQTAYQAALASFAKALPTSLLDYLR
jgi:flagellar hook-associated protein 3 FlgL